MEKGKRDPRVSPICPFVYLIVIATPEQHAIEPAISSNSMPQSRIMISFMFVVLPFVVLKIHQRQKCSIKYEIILDVKKKRIKIY